MAVKHIVFNAETGKTVLKTFKSEKEYKAFKDRPEQASWRVRVDLKVESESANKKLRQLEKKGLTSSPAYKQAIHQIHLLTGDKTATRFPKPGKNHVENQKAVQAARAFNRYETATQGGWERVQRRARKGFNKTFGKQAQQLTQMQYEAITAMYDTLDDVFGALIPQSNETFEELIEIGGQKYFDESDLEDFALDLQQELEHASEAVKEHTREIISRALDEFAHGYRPNAKQLVEHAKHIELQKLRKQAEKVGVKFPYK